LLTFERDYRVFATAKGQAGNNCVKNNDDFQIEPSSEEAACGKELIEAAPAFEYTPLSDVHWKSPDEKLVGAFAAKTANANSNCQHR